MPVLDEGLCGFLDTFLDRANKLVGILFMPSVRNSDQADQADQAYLVKGGAKPVRLPRLRILLREFNLV